MTTRWNHSTCLGQARLRLGSDRERRWYRFGNPVGVIRAETLDAVVPSLQEVEAATEGGCHAVGFVAYEASAAFDSALTTHPPLAGLPLVWFALYPERKLEEGVCLGTDSQGEQSEPSLRWLPKRSETDHAEQVAAIRRSIDRGDTYQVNLTFPFEAEGLPRAEVLFASLLRRQDVPHAGYLDLGRWAVCSASPELFFRREGDRVTVRPMKGTAARGATPGEDARLRRQLAMSIKDRAENLMIVDMLRNDLGRVAVPGSVAVPDLYRIEEYATVWQMTSTVTARTDASLAQLFTALFPSASITGAPKASAMQRIRDLEDGPRGVYCGALGWVGPGRQTEFNVAIRTALVDREADRASYGVGGGIVWDSHPAAEYQEALIKARSLGPMPRVAEASESKLLESLLWRPGQRFWLLDEHLDRLFASARALGFESVSRAGVVERLQGVEGTLPAFAHKVRILLGSDGRIEVTASPLESLPEPRRVGLALRPVDAADPRLRHKIWPRTLYDTLRDEVRDALRDRLRDEDLGAIRISEAASEVAIDDVLLWNQAGELTESSIANLVLEIDGRKLTPPVSAGLLPGVFRAVLLRRGELTEATLRGEDLERAGGCWLINSVRGWMPAEVVTRSGLVVPPGS